MAQKLRTDLSAGVGSSPAHPSALIQVPARSKRPPLTLEDRLEHGNLTVAETCALRNCSKTSFYADLKAGLVAIRKIGRKSVVSGPVAKRYARGESLAAE